MREVFSPPEPVHSQDIIRRVCGESAVSHAATGNGLETDPRFPSGPWVGFFLQKWPPLGKQWMELRLTFRSGDLTGEGRDIIGTFVLAGSYSVADGRCHWRKTYLGKHDVYYSGFNEGKGIWGTWEIPSGLATPIRLHGGFHIWPEGMGDPTEPGLKEAADLPVEADAEALPLAEPVVGWSTAGNT
jgi:hypothetical protein